jgi:hypothetical protein
MIAFLSVQLWWIAGVLIKFDENSALFKLKNHSCAAKKFF